jgi:hypothetical protein
MIDLDERNQAVGGEVSAVPWEIRPYRLVSWWDMKPFRVQKFLWLVRSFEQLIHDQEQDQPMTDEDKKSAATLMPDLAEECEELDLPSTADQFNRLESAAKNATTYRDLSILIPDLLNRLEDECGRKIVMAIDAQYAPFFNNPQFFDSSDAQVKKVSEQFPSAAEDIAEAGKCLACGRDTACVMHLGRVMEAGLKALAGTLGVGPQNDWGKYLGETEKELQKRMKASGARTPDEQFYAEAHAMFDSVRRAWRNPTMHVDKTYTEERAEEILIAVRSFMRHLATKVGEDFLADL